MNFTFGIITAGLNDSFLPIIIESIKNQEIPEYEIILVGGNKDFDCIHIPFDESIKPAWITRKKNLITNYAKYENIVYLHDYIKFNENWYEGFLKFNSENPIWDVCMNKIINLDGSRYMDWIIWDDPDYGKGRTINEKWCNGGIKFNGGPGLPPYEYNKTHYMFIPGYYWVGKKIFMEHNILNDGLVWGQGEDVEFSCRIRNKYKYLMNTYSSVHLLKQKQNAF